MASETRWWARAAAACVGLALALVVPALAWASEAAPAVEFARRRPRLGGFGFFGALCCLVVVSGIVLAVVLIARRRPPR